MTTLKEITEAFALFYEGVHRREFRKTLELTKFSERQFHPLIRSFLLGYFGNVSPEVASELPGSKTRYGRIDYVIDEVAVELAVRRPNHSRATLSQVTNATEAKKLLKWDGRALLVLYDFSRDPFSEKELEAYRDWPSLGRGNHKVSAFNVAYFFRDKEGSQLITKNIRVG